MKWFACEKAAMEISREEEEGDKTIRRQDEVIVGERIELHSSGLSALGSPGLQVRDRWGVGWQAKSCCSFKTSFTFKSDPQNHQPEEESIFTWRYLSHWHSLNSNLPGNKSQNLTSLAELTSCWPLYFYMSQFLPEAGHSPEHSPEISPGAVTHRWTHLVLDIHLVLSSTPGLLSESFTCSLILTCSAWHILTRYSHLVFHIYLILPPDTCRPAGGHWPGIPFEAAHLDTLTCCWTLTCCSIFTWSMASYSQLHSDTLTCAAGYSPVD